MADCFHHTVMLVYQATVLLFCLKIVILVVYSNTANDCPNGVSAAGRLYTRVCQ